MIKVDHVTVKYGMYDVLTDITFSVKEGDFLALVGPNGSGKTTLVKTLLGLLKPAAGSITFFNGSSTEETSGPSLEGGLKKIGYLPQKSSYSDPRFPATVKEVVASGLLARRKIPKILSEKDREAISDVLKLLKIEDLAEKRVGKLSGGQQQRVHLARALVGEPSLLVLDEPTGALDPHTRDCFYYTLTNLNKIQGVTIIIVTHDSHSISQYAPLILYLDRKILFYGTIKDFNENTTSEHYFGRGPIHGKRQC